MVEALARSTAGAARRDSSWLVVSACSLAVVLGLGAPAAVALDVPGPSFAELVEEISPAVVNIATSKEVVGGRQPDVPVPEVPPGSPFEDFFREYFENQGPNAAPRRSSSLGSGFVIDAEGFVVTNNHVVGDADRIEVIFNDERTVEAELIGRDPKTDLALLKLNEPGPYPTVHWGDSDSVRVGDWIVAIGNPFGIGQSVTAGIVSARGRDIRSGPYDDFIQVDAPINRGNSGGPTFGLDGGVVGVNTAIFSPSGGNVGIGFAIPANLAKPVIDSLRRFGKVKRGWLGVRIQTVTDELAENLGLDEVAGAMVANITPGGPAEQADIVSGDVILTFDGRKVDRMRSLPRIVAETEIEKEVEVRIWRRGEEMDVRVTVGELPEDEALADLGTSLETPGGVAQQQIEGLGITVAALTDELRTSFSLPAEAQGLVITEVDPDGPGAEKSLQAGDLILEVGQEQVGSPPEMMAKVQQAQSENKRSVLLLVDRQGDTRFVALPFS